MQFATIKGLRIEKYTLQSQNWRESAKTNKTTRLITARRNMVHRPGRTQLSPRGKLEFSSSLLPTNRRKRYVHTLYRKEKRRKENLLLHLFICRLLPSLSTLSLSYPTANGVESF
jgi:hypothetical protein